VKKEQKKPVLTLVKQAVNVWEEMRPRDTTPATKRELACKLVGVGKGHIKELAMNHASSRAIQAALKHGSAEVRASVWAECKGSVVEMAMSPHGSHVIRKLANTASKAELSGASPVQAHIRGACSMSTG
jgi:pumilio homology domain family member 6